MSKREKYSLGALFNVSFANPSMVGCAVVEVSRGYETMVGDLEQGDVVVIISNNMRKTDDFEEVFVLSRVGVGWFPTCYIIAT